jgi:hypothetical protein
MLPSRSRTSQLTSSIDRRERQEQSTRRQDLAERIAWAKIEALRRIQDLPWYALEKDDWHHDVESVSPTAEGAPQELAEIAARIRRCRTAADPQPMDAAAPQSGSVESGSDIVQPTVVRMVRRPALSSEAQRTQLTVALLLIEIQLDKLMELSRNWQSV